MLRRDFVKGLAATGAIPLCGAGRSAAAAEVPEFARGAEEMPPILEDAENVRSPLAKGGRAASFFIDDAIWFLRDVTRQRPASMFDHPFLGVLKECRECSVGPRYRYDGRRERRPHGHGLKLEQNRKPEVGFYWRDTRNAAIASSRPSRLPARLCGEDPHHVQPHEG